MKRRGSGILLHITSLPSPYGIGDMGPEAYFFADYLAEFEQSYWQILPLAPTLPGLSPYSSPSAFAGNPLLISPEFLIREGMIERHIVPGFPDGHLDLRPVAIYKEGIFREAFHKFRQGYEPEGLGKFRHENTGWLDDYAFYEALKVEFRGAPWYDWPREIRDRRAKAVKYWTSKLNEAMEYEIFLQYIFDLQWKELMEYCGEFGIQIIGDIPFYVALDSAEVWANPRVFKLDREKRPAFVSGVPPDYFSRTGQLWGNPVYNWSWLRESGYAWWINRMRKSLERCHVLRIDHFRGFVSSWEVPAGQKTAVKGKWADAPGDDFFRALIKYIPNPALIAEDLGYITADVRELLGKLGLPGMKVLLFAFGEDIENNPYIPHNVGENSVIYTGTHDNNTSRGWFEEEASDADKERLFSYLGRKVNARRINWELLRLAMGSVSSIAVFPMQDILGLGADSRMNDPAGNHPSWQWRLKPGELDRKAGERLRELTRLYGRA